MFLEQLSLFNFRNLATQKVKFKEGVNVFYGDNAQGKTNLLETIYLLSTGKSFRARTDHELVRWGEESAKVSGKASFLEIELLVKQNKKELLINKQPKKLTDLIGSFLVVLFTPADIEIVSGSPDKRRRFLDQIGVNLSRDYLISLVKLNRIIRTRNQILWQIKQGQRADLTVWDSQLAKQAVVIWKLRFDLVLQLSENLQKLSRRILGGDLQIVYATQAQLDSDKKMQENFLAELGVLREEEIQKSLTLIGPQRDDFKLLFEIEEDNKVVSKDLTVFGSRGEQRAASLTLKLAEIEIIEKNKETRPTLLLDDVLGELDESHQRLLLNSLKKGQAFLTTTDVETITKNLKSGFQKFHLEKGKITLVP